SRADGLPPLLAGGEVAGDDFAVAVLRREGVGDETAVARQLRTLNRAPAVVVGVSERPLVSRRFRETECRSDKKHGRHERGAGHVRFRNRGRGFDGTYVTRRPGRPPRKIVPTPRPGDGRGR